MIARYALSENGLHDILAHGSSFSVTRSLMAHGAQLVASDDEIAQFLEIVKMHPQRQREFWEALLQYGWIDREPLGQQNLDDLEGLSDERWTRWWRHVEFVLLSHKRVETLATDDGETLATDDGPCITLNADHPSNRLEIVKALFPLDSPSLAARVDAASRSFNGNESRSMLAQDNLIPHIKRSTVVVVVDEHLGGAVLGHERVRQTSGPEDQLGEVAWLLRLVAGNAHKRRKATIRFVTSSGVKFGPKEPQDTVQTGTLVEEMRKLCAGVLDPRPGSVRAVELIVTPPRVLDDRWIRFEGSRNASGLILLTKGLDRLRHDPLEYHGRPWTLTYHPGNYGPWSLDRTYEHRKQVEDDLKRRGRYGVTSVRLWKAR